MIYTHITTTATTEKKENIYCTVVTHKRKQCSNQEKNICRDRENCTKKSISFFYLKQTARTKRTIQRSAEMLSSCRAQLQTDTSRFQTKIQNFISWTREAKKNTQQNRAENENKTSARRITRILWPIKERKKERKKTERIYSNINVNVHVFR